VVKAAVVGGGVFGATAAVELARAGAKVDLFDQANDILTGATARCQARLHHGYHYPRSDTTAAAARDAAPRFADRFRGAVLRGRHHYVIADDSKVPAADYLAFCDRLGLPYELVDHPQVRGTCLRVQEAFIDVNALRRQLRAELHQRGVNVHLGQRVEPGPQSGYDLTVMATYGQPWLRPLRYEVCEVALVQLGRYGAGESFVVVDGDFVSLDPMGHGHALYDVHHSVHASNVGYAPDIPTPYADLLTRLGPAHTPLSRFEDMTTSASRFLRGIEPGGQGVSIYAGSLFSVRAVLPDVDATDERPTLVERDGDTVWVLSGKICTALDAAQRVAEMASVAA
jgi:hypothetical protein